MTSNFIEVLAVEFRHTGFHPIPLGDAVQLHVIFHFIKPTLYCNSCSGLFEFRYLTGIRGPSHFPNPHRNHPAS